MFFYLAKVLWFLLQPSTLIALLIAYGSILIWTGWARWGRRFVTVGAILLLVAGLSPLWPTIRAVIADAGHESRRLARDLMRQDGRKLQIVKRRQRAFKITGLTWIVERSFAWLGRNRRFSKDYEYRVQTSETMLDIAATRLMLNRLAPA